MREKSKLASTLRLAVPLGLTAVVIWTIGTDEVIARLAASQPVWLGLAMVAAQVQILLSALRWRLTAARLGTDIPLGRAVGEYYVSGLVNMSLPGGVAGDAARVFRSRSASGLEVAAHAVVIERLAGQIALGAILLAGVLLFGSSGARLMAGGLALVLVVVAILLARRTRTAADRQTPGLARRFSTAMAKSWLDPSTAGRQIALSLVIVAANIATFACAAMATGTSLGFGEAVIGIPLILLAMLIPFSIGGWGYREGAAALVFPALGASAAAGVGASIVFGVIILVANLPGLAFVSLRRRPETGSEASRETPAP